MIWHQSHYIEVVQGTIFLEQNMIFGLILGWLAILKKVLGRLWATFESSFCMLSGAKNGEFILKYCSIHTKKLHYIYIYIFFWILIGWIFTVTCVLLYWRHLPARLFYNDFCSNTANHGQNVLQTSIKLQINIRLVIQWFSRLVFWCHKPYCTAKNKDLYQVINKLWKNCHLIFL